MIIEKETILEEIENLEQKREQIVAQVNQVLGEIKGKIDLYNELLAKDEQKPEEMIVSDVG